MSNELLGPAKTFKVLRLWAGAKDKSFIPYDGYHILEENLRYFNGTCHRIISDTSGQYTHGISACWFDLYLPALWFVGALLLSYILLRFCVRDPH